MRRGAAQAILLAAAALAACGREESRPTSPPPQAQVQARPAPPAPYGWSVQASATTGVALIHYDDQSQEALRIACRRNPADLYVSVPRIKRVGSEERLTLGAGDELVTLVASPTTPADAPVEASGPPSPTFVAAVERGDRISVAYGATQFGPLPSVPEREKAAFVAGCRAAG